MTVRLKTPVPPVAEKPAVVESRENVQASSFRIVPVPVVFEIVAFVGFDKLTVKVSSASTIESPIT